MQSSPWMRRTGQFLSQNSPSIMSAAAVGGVVATAYLTAKATLKAKEQISDLEDANRDYGTNEGVTPKEKVEACWKFYVPAGISGAATIACVIGANQIGIRRQAAMLGAYTLADTAFREYKDEVLTQIGANKEQKVVDEIAKRKMDENPPDNQVIITGGGEQLCYDTLSGRYFYSDAESIRRAANDVNEEILGGNMWASLNEFWARVGLGDTTLGDEVGFNLGNTMDITFTSHLTPENKPCLAITYTRLPKADYGKVY